MTLGASDIIAFLATADAAEARRFYEHTLGLRFVEEQPFALVFDANGTMLRIAKVDSVAAATYSVLGWRVTDIAAAVRALASKGVAFERYGGMGQDDDGVWTSPDGAKVTWFRDPDGNLLSLTEFPD